jgi:hypothetical protein
VDRRIPSWPDRKQLHVPVSAARRSSAMSIFCMPSIACIVRRARAGSGSASSSGSAVGMICQDRP